MLGSSGRRSVYPACTSLGRIRCFYRFCRLVESVSYVQSMGLKIPTPPASTIQIPMFYAAFFGFETYLFVPELSERIASSTFCLPRLQPKSLAVQSFS